MYFNLSWNFISKKGASFKAECSHRLLSTWNWSEKSRKRFTAFCNAHSTQLLMAQRGLAPLYLYLANVMSSTLREEVIVNRVQQKVASQRLFIPANEEACITQVTMAACWVQQSRWPSLTYFHCSGESVGVTSYLFLRAAGCPAETAPVSLCSQYNQTLTHTRFV